jgi:hypothetical protein
MLLRCWTFCVFIPKPIHLFFFSPSYLCLVLPFPLYSFLFHFICPSVSPSLLFFALPYCKTVYGYHPEQAVTKNSAYVYFIIAIFPSGQLCSVRAIKQRHKQTYRHYGLHKTRNLNSCLFNGRRESGGEVRLG